jgi:hypothetical protein
MTMTPESRKTIKKYFFIVKSTQNTWVPILSPFVTTSQNENSGEFLSSSWYKNAIPDEYECAVIKIVIDYADANRQSTSDTTRIMECVSIMNDCDGREVDDLGFVIMRHFMKKKYLHDVHVRLRKLLETNNSDTATTHATMHTAVGTFGIQKNHPPHMYCPSFSIN